jgi:hypothetical protein
MQASTRPSPGLVSAQNCFTSAAQALTFTALSNHRLAALGQVLEVRLEALPDLASWLHPCAKCPPACFGRDHHLSASDMLLILVPRVFRLQFIDDIGQRLLHFQI